ncbi:disease resistance protein RGA4-like [Phragmites australis]|uniref:disease resistance protein RGA4-like n=1 Tax=Phragmites australis TaxID=29695 RepID=UPI002D78F8CE|nr:disease resistance protein RGA4-like [Phragmites australis]
MEGAVRKGLKGLQREMRLMIGEIKLKEEKNQGATHDSKIVLLKELACDIEDFIDLKWVPGAAGALVLSAIEMDPRTDILEEINNFKESIQRVRNWQPDAGSSHGGDGAASSFCPSAASAPPCSPEATLKQTSLRHFLQDKRYLVVIDDVDRPGVWQAIKHEFPENGHSSRIIVTTSVHSVAAECSWGSYVYTMQGLGKDESKEIFWGTVGQENRTLALQGASKGILEKCGGLPLALISVANYLRRQGRAGSRVTGGLTIDQCNRAARTLGDKIQKGQDAEFVKINRALLQCYNNLPDYVHRSCLLYASVFPRGRPINSKVLIRRWMAEGLVAAHGTVTDEEGATCCLEEFIDRSIIEPVEINNARVAWCRVHSIMLEFIIHEAVSKSFVALVDKDELLSNNETIYEGITFGVRVRRLSVQDSSNQGVDDAVKSKSIDLSIMRSLTIFGSPLLDLQVCKSLRVLDLRRCTGVDNIVFGDICKLLFLKYLSLRGTRVGNLPSEIRHLEDLETLDIRDTGVEVVPIEVIRLQKLAHLLGRFKLPHGISSEELEKGRLQTLAGVVITKADQSYENIILHTRKLRKVKIYEATSDSSNSPRNKKAKLSCSFRDSGGASTSNSSLLQIKELFTGSKALQILSIDSSDFSKEFLSFLEAPCAITSIKLRGKLENLPDTPILRQLVVLNKLLLISTGLSCEVLSTLQSLPCLEYLKLEEGCDGFSGGSFIVTSGGFPSLKRLCFEASELPEVQFQEGSMKSLSILDLLCPYSEIPGPRRDMHLCPSYQTCDPEESRLGVVGVSYLENLNEVILHHSTGE